jgi:arylsulfatase A-like enzyme
MRNVVMIVADQLRADHLGYRGRVPVRTPHIDSLALGGHDFSQAFVANPVCMPNRATIMTGLWPSAHGLRTNGLPLNPDIETFVRVLRRGGWRTSAVGKLHLQPMGYPYEDYQLDQIRAAMPAVWEQAVRGPFGEDFQSWEAFDRHADGELVIPPDYYGFDDVALVVGHGDRVTGNYVKWARARGFDPVTQAGRDMALWTYADWGHVWESAVPAELHATTYITDEAIDRLHGYAKSEDPFCLFVSYPDPHHPFAPPTEYFRRHRPEDMPVPASFFDDHALSPEYVQKIVARRGTPDIDPMMVWSPTEDQYRNALAAELGSIEFIDDSVGRILASLGELGLADDTLIVFTSDHGDVFGDHGLLLKHFTHYSGVITVPMIFSGGGLGAGRHDALVSSADIAPTVLQLLDAPELVGIQGTSLEPLIDERNVPWRTSVLIEEDQPYGLDVLPGPVRIRTVVTDKVRYTRIAGNAGAELYDRQGDPGERVNLAAEPDAEALRTEANAAMVEELMRVADDSRVPFAAA